MDEDIIITEYNEYAKQKHPLPFIIWLKQVKKINPNNFSDDEFWEEYFRVFNERG